MNEELIIDNNEDYAFYQSGLSADGCLEKLDDYTRKAIKRYGEILLEKQKEDFIKGFKGCCYCCEPVGELNQRLEKEQTKLKRERDEARNQTKQWFEEWHLTDKAFRDTKAERDDAREKLCRMLKLLDEYIQTTHD